MWPCSIVREGESSVPSGISRAGKMLVGRLGDVEGGGLELVGWICRANMGHSPLPFLTAATDEDEEGKLPEDIMKVNPFLYRICKGRAS